MIAALTLLSVGMHTFLFPPWDQTALAWVALVPFLLVLLRVSPRRGALVGLAWGTLMMWGVGHWVPAALTFYYEQPAWFGVLFALAASLVFSGSYYAGFGACAAWVGARTRGIPRLLLLSFLWIAWELARARVLTGDPWLLLGYALVGNEYLVQAADLGGVYALSFLVILVNTSVAEALSSWPRFSGSKEKKPWLRAARLLLPAALTLLAYAGYGARRFALPLPAGKEITVSVVQGNNDLGAQWREELYGRGLDRYLQMSTAAIQEQHPDLLVWPESAVTFYLAREPRFQEQIRRMLHGSGAELIAGGPHFEDEDPARPHYYNSAFHLDRNGIIRGRYDKAHLLPFGEYFPLRAIELLRRRFERTRYFTPGDGGRLLHTELGQVAPVICFEGLFPELVREQMRGGADLLLNLSNDAWLLSPVGAEQHMRMVVLRAVENRSWLIRSTTTGVSVIVDPLGRIRARADIGAATVLSQRLAMAQEATAYKRCGDVFAYMCLLNAIVGMVWIAARD